jgi:UDP-N-acetylmuramyl tripeptide synthase
MHRAGESMEFFPGISGRQQAYYLKEVDWYVDFAHTPQGLEHMLEYLQSIK